MGVETYAGDVQSSFVDYLRMVPAILILIVFVLLPPLGAISIAKTICPLRKNEKSSGRIIGFYRHLRGQPCGTVCPDGDGFADGFWALKKPFERMRISATARFGKNPNHESIR